MPIPLAQLAQHAAVYLYPSTCLFEGTVMSLGRGTSFPFQIYGHPNYKGSAFCFIRSMPGAKILHCSTKSVAALIFEIFPMSKSEKRHRSFLCHRRTIIQIVNLFTPFFEKLIGVDYVRKDIMAGKNRPKKLK